MADNVMSLTEPHHRGDGKAGVFGVVIPPGAHADAFKPSPDMVYSLWYVNTQDKILQIPDAVVREAAADEIAVVKDEWTVEETDAAGQKVLVTYKKADAAFFLFWAFPANETPNSYATINTVFEIKAAPKSMPNVREATLQFATKVWWLKTDGTVQWQE